jgi:selenoprotein W-related protein
MSQRIEIEYCTGCHWLIRAAWVAQELLSTFESELDEVALKPGGTGGVFEIRLNDGTIWSRKEEGRFPEIKELKQRIRDAVAPGRDLGHVDH